MGMEKLYEHCKEFQIKYCDVDFNDVLKPSVALSLMEEVACSSADELGFGYAYVKPKGYAFMVTNVCFNCLRPIPLGANLLVKTWPNPPSYIVFGREYQFYLEGEKVLDATSRWCLVDVHTGKLVQSKAIEGQDYSTYNTTKVMPDVQWKIPMFAWQEEPLRFTLTIANSEYDHNMHVNNTRYADYCLNCFSVEELSQLQLSRFQISYVKQCKEGDVLHFYRKEQADKSYLILGINQEDAIVVQAHVHFQKEGNS